MSELPTREAILQWIADNPTLTSKRDIAKAFGVKGAMRIDLKRMLRDLEDEGLLAKRKRSYRDPDSLPPVTVLSVMAPDADGDLFARPLEWHGEGAEPRVLLVLRASDPALGEGDRILARLNEAEAGEGHSHEGRLIRRIGTNPLRLLGVFRKTSEGGRIVPVDKGSNKEWLVAADKTFGAKDGELVEAEQAGPKGRLGLPKARVMARLGDPTAPRAVSLIAIHQHGIPDHFSDEAVAEADAAKPAGLSGRTDLRDLPLLTIDPADARDRDDAVLAIPDDDPANEGGFHLWVAIADVAHYVTPGSALDREARTRGNSTYFPDRVVPMLPDRLSGDLCSLHENVPRACLAVEMRIDAHGRKLTHRFVRGLMSSVGSLNYEEVQAAVDGQPNEKTAPLIEVLRPLFAAYEALKRARAERQPLELDLPERQIVLSDEGRVVSVDRKARLDAHRLIEEFMVLANVAAAEELIRLKSPLLFRVHEEPSPEKLDALREVAQASGLTLAKGQVLKTQHLNRLLAQAAETEVPELISLATLRAMTQAYYSPKNFGHFGLALKNYAHFTSPIRRYADLIVHRALIAAHGWGDDGLTPEDIAMLEETGQAISDTERRSMMAERDTTDRYLAAFLNDRVGDEMGGRITGIAKFGVFAALDGTGADALIPMRALGGEYFHYDRESQTLMGADSGREISIGQRVTLRLTEAVPVTGGIVAELLAIEDKPMPRGPSTGRGGKPPRRKAAAAKRSDRQRKVKRRRK